MVPGVASRYHFLLIENEPADAFLIERAFRKVRFNDTLFVCLNLADAKNYISGNNQFEDRALYPAPDWLVCDLNFPGESVPKLVRWIRCESPLKRLPIIILTGSSSAVSREEVLAVGANQVFEKPGDSSKLMDIFLAIPAMS
jgi:CheY-like chemotaxis protein